MAYVYRRPFDYARRVRRDVQPHVFGIELSAPAITLVARAFDIVSTVSTASSTAPIRRVGVYRKIWNYAERYRRDVQPHTSTANFTAVSLTLASYAWDVQATQAPGQGTASNAPIRRVGIYRKRWNYAERNSLVDIIWVEQVAGNTVTFSKPTLAFNARPFTITNAAAISLTKATIAFVSQQWIIGSAPTVNFTRATIAFSAKVFSTGLTPGVEFTRASLLFNARTWGLAGGGNVVPLTAPGIILFTPRPWDVNPGVGSFGLSRATIVFSPRPWLVTQIAYDPTAVSVQAYRNGHYGGLYRFEGDVFNIFSPFEYSPYWMTFLSAVPSTWEPYLPTYTPATDRRIYKPLRTEDIEDWVDTGIR